MTKLAQKAKIPCERQRAKLHSFFALKFHDGDEDLAKVEAIEKALNKAGIEITLMARDVEECGNATIPEGKTLMKDYAFPAMKQCDCNIIEFSEKGVGLGMNGGFCYAVGKPIYVIAKTNSDISTTMANIATEVICGKTPPTSDSANYGSSVPFITIPDMHGSVYTTTTERFLSDKGVTTQANKTLPENSICVSCIASVGLVCLTAEPSQTNQQINSIICKKDISPFYVYIKMTTLTEYLKQLGAGGSTTLNVNKTLFGQIPILLPDERTMTAFHEKVKPLFAAIRANQYEMQHLETMKSLLLTRISSR